MFTAEQISRLVLKSYFALLNRTYDVKGNLPLISGAAIVVERLAKSMAARGYQYVGKRHDRSPKNPQPRGAMGKNSRSLAEKHDIECSIDLHEQFYLTLVIQKNVQPVLEMVSTYDSCTKRPMKI